MTAIVLAVWTLLGSAPGTLETSVFPDTSYDASIPTLDDVLTFGFGQDSALHHEAMAYARALAEASPLAVLKPYGQSWEGRELALLIVSAKENLDELEWIRSGYAALADSRKTQPTALEELLNHLPVCVWFSESVHGDETSGSDSALFLAYHLVAGHGDPAVKALLADAIIVFDLVQNPDGRDRFITYSRQTRAPGGDPDPRAAEHHEIWPGGRFNHYLFDLNRDWFAATQKETQARIASYLSWFPQVVVDVHELGPNGSYFSAAPAAPANPMLPQAMLEQYEAFGRAIGAALDARRIDYFHDEIFDSFFPGYGESWPSLHGSVGLLLEQPGVTGLAMKRYDGTLMHYSQAVRNQSVASLSLIEYAAKHRRSLLEFFHAYRRDAIAEGRDAQPRQVFLLPGNDSGRAHALACLLRRQGIDVERLEDDFRNLGGTDVLTGKEDKFEVSVGTYLVRFDQPAGRLARSLLLPSLSLDGEFVAEQDRRYERRMEDQIFDITGWSLPLMHGVDTFLVSGSGFKGTGGFDLSPGISLPDRSPHLGYLIPYGISSLRSIASLLTHGIRVSFTTSPITVNGRELPRGSLLIRRLGNPADLHETLMGFARRNGFDVVGVDQSWFEDGPSFGSYSVFSILPPRVALVWGEVSSSRSAGWIRFALERELGIIPTLIRVEDLHQISLSDFDLVVCPDGEAIAWKKALNSKALEKIRLWLEDGGILVGVGGAAEWFCDRDVALLSSAVEIKGGMIEPEDSDGFPEHPMRAAPDAETMVEPILEQPRRIPGALVCVDFDVEHWLAFGMNAHQAVMADSNRVFRPVRLDKGVNVGRFAEENRLVLSGYVPKDMRTQLALKSFVMVEKRNRGLVVAFAQDPYFRGFLPGLLPLTGNILYFGRAIGMKNAY